MNLNKFILAFLIVSTGCVSLKKNIGKTTWETEKDNEALDIILNFRNDYECTYKVAQFGEDYIGYYTIVYDTIKVNIDKIFDEKTYNETIVDPNWKLTFVKEQSKLLLVEYQINSSIQKPNQPIEFIQVDK